MGGVKVDRPGLHTKKIAKSVMSNRVVLVKLVKENRIAIRSIAKRRHTAIKKNVVKRKLTAPTVGSDTKCTIKPHGIIISMSTIIIMREGDG